MRDQLIQSGLGKAPEVAPGPAEDGGKADSGRNVSDGSIAIFNADKKNVPIEQTIGLTLELQKTAPHVYRTALHHLSAAHWPPTSMAVRVSPLVAPQKVMLVGSYADSRTYYEWSERMQIALGGTFHLKYEGGGHCVTFRSHACVTKLRESSSST